MEKRWTKTDEKRVRFILKRIADDLGGWQGFADRLGMKADSARATVEAWSRRGRVPVAQISAVLKLAAGSGIDATAAELHPDARSLAGTA
jgi:hypothetical protein